MLIDDCENMLSDDDFDEKQRAYYRAQPYGMPQKPRRRTIGFNEEDLYGSNSYDNYRLKRAYFDVDGPKGRNKNRYVQGNPLPYGSRTSERHYGNDRYRDTVPQMGALSPRDKFLRQFRDNLDSERSYTMDPGHSKALLRSNDINYYDVDPSGDTPEEQTLNNPNNNQKPSVEQIRPETQDLI